MNTQSQSFQHEIQFQYFGLSDIEWEEWKRRRKFIPVNLRHPPSLN